MAEVHGQATSKREPRCKRLSASSTVQHRRFAHAAKMVMRRIGQRNRQPGFTPVLNKRVDGAIATAALAIIAANPKISPVEAHQQAVRQVAQGLPAPRMVSDWQQTRGSKSDDPAWRDREFHR